MKAGATGALRSLHMLVYEKRLAVAVRVSSAPMQLATVTTALPIGEPRTFRLLSVPFYLVAELPRLIGEMAREDG